MELWIRLEGATAEPCELAVDVEAEHTVADLLAAIEHYLATDLEPMMLKRNGQQLLSSATVEASGLRSGDTLLPLQRGSQATTHGAGLRLLIAGGPDAGRAFRLNKEAMIIGRSTRADITLVDPAVSSQHASLSVHGQSVMVDDLASLNGTFLNGDAVSGPTALDPGAILEVGEFALRLEPAKRPAAETHVVDGLVQFTRGPRISPPPSAAVFELPSPPDEPQKRRLSLASALIPLATAPVLVAVTHQRSYFAMAALSPLIAIGSVVEDRRYGRRDHAKKLTSFRQFIASTDEAMASNLRDETADRWKHYPDPADILRRVFGPDSDLWERRFTDADALELRIGWGDLPSTSRWSMPEGGAAALRDEAAAKLQAYGLVRSAPVTINLQVTPVIGVIGEESAIDEAARWLVVQAAVLHSPRNLSLAIALDESRAETWEWAPWLPHCRNEWAPDGRTAFAVGDSDAVRLVLALNDLVATRHQARLDHDEMFGAVLPVVLVVIDQRLRIPRSVLATLLEQGTKVGLRVVWLGDRAERLPGETGVIAAVKENRVDLTVVAGGQSFHDMQRDQCSVGLATSAGYALAGVHDASATVGGNAGLPNVVSLSGILGGASTAASLLERWKRPSEGLGAPIGVSAAGLFSIDFRRDGPHALLGGTTGAGKSEMLQTLVTSMAAHHAPTRLTFLLVDYKGGAAFKDCVDLPHVVGLVTDLSSHLVRRALVSLNAEIHRREHLLASVGAKDIIEMELRAPDLAPANLVVVIDEFATLAKELPEFVDGVVNVAQRGRSLGVHMLLATQRPAGAINDNIRANTNLRMALRMNDDADSRDVIGTGVAAVLPRALPGRVFVKTGAAELAEVQAAYSGAHTLPVGAFRLPVVGALRRGSVVLDQIAKPEAEDTAPTDLQVVVEAAIEAASLAKLAKQPSPWLPPLPDFVALNDLDDPASPTTAVVGLMDQPQRQSQPTFGLDLAAEGSLLVLGTSRAGKTTLLRTMALSLALANSPDQLHIYVLDFASRGLKALEALPHCGAVITGDEIDRAQRAFSMFERWVADRKHRFAEVGASSLAEYQRLAAPGHELARLVVLLDSYAGFSTAFENVEYGARIDLLTRLVSEGSSLGLHFVITASRRNSLPTSLASLIQSSIVLRLADVEDYSSAGLDPKVAKSAVLPEGRGFVSPGSFEVQCAVVGADASGDAQQAAITQAGTRLKQLWPALEAPRITTLPAHVTLAPLLGMSRPMRPVIGLGERELAPIAVDVEEGHFLVVGPIRCGKSTTLAAIASGLHRADSTLDITLIAPRRTPLTSLDVWTSVAQKVTEVEARLAELLNLVEVDDATRSHVLIIDDGHELTDGPAASTLELLVRKGRDTNLRLVAASEVGAAHRAYSGWISEIKKDRQGILLQPDSSRDGDLFGIQLPRTRTQPPGRGFLVTRIGAEGLQVGSK